MKYYYEVWVDADYPYPICIESETELSKSEVAELAKKRVIADFEADFITEEAVMSIDEKTYRSTPAPYEYMEQEYGEEEECGEWDYEDDENAF